MAGIALGTALGAWINVALLTWLGRSRALLAIETAVLARLAGRRCWRRWRRAAGAWVGRAVCCRRHGDIAALAAAIACAALGYGAVLLLFRGRLPLARAALMRLFVALPIPDAVAQGLMLMQGGVPGARWQAREQLHLTLRFIGEVDGRDARAIWTMPWRASMRRPSTCNCMAWASSATSSRMRLWAAARPNDCWIICSARWTPPSAASASRRTRTNSPRMSPWRGCAIPIWTRCANG